MICGALGRQRHRLEVRHHVVLQVVHRCVDDMRAPVAHHQRVAVGRRAGAAAHGDRARGAGDVLDDHRLAERHLHPIRHDPRDRVGRPADRVSHQHGDRARRIGLRGGASGRDQHGRGRNGNRQLFIDLSRHRRSRKRTSADCAWRAANNNDANAEPPCRYLDSRGPSRIDEHHASHALAPMAGAPGTAAAHASQDTRQGTDRLRREPRAGGPQGAQRGWSSATATSARARPTSWWRSAATA